MTRSAVLLATVATLLAATPAAAAPAPKATPAAVRDVASLGFDRERFGKLDAYMAQAVSDGRVSGLTVFVARHGKVAAFKTYGARDLASGAPMTPDTVFRLYSMTKPVVGVGMMILFEEGKWRLDDPVSKFIPEFKSLQVMTGVDAQGKPILEPVRRAPTMRELMSHTAGFGYGLTTEHPVDRMFREKRVLDSNGLHQMVERVAEIPLMYQPGTDWSYSAAVDIQGRIIEKLSGQTLGDFLKARVFDPLAMKDTGFTADGDRAARLATLYAADPRTGKLAPANQLAGGMLRDYTKPPTLESGGGGLVSTTVDYARFAQMLLNEGELDGVRLLAPSTVELMTRNVIPDEVLARNPGIGRYRFDRNTGFGLDLMVVNDPRAAGLPEGRGTFSWAGAGGTWFWVDPQNDLVFVGMAQRLGGTGGDDLSTQARTLTYQALVRPER